MADVYSRITEVDGAAIEQVARAMEVSAADPQHRAMVEVYLRDLGLETSARVLEIGCGTGAIARIVASWPGVGEVVGMDPSPRLLEKARGLSAGFGNLSFQVADGRELGVADASFDAVILHRVLSHVPAPERVLSEAFRVLRRAGKLAVFDGDYATITLATGEFDPIQTCVAAFAPAYVHDPWIARRLAGMVQEAGFSGSNLRSHGYVQVRDPDYMLSIADRGADVLVTAGRIGRELGDALKAEARRRVQAQAFFGHVAYVSLIAHKRDKVRDTDAEIGVP